jgi:hypothetical protein
MPLLRATHRHRSWIWRASRASREARTLCCAPWPAEPKPLCSGRRADYLCTGLGKTYPLRNMHLGWTLTEVWPLLRSDFPLLRSNCRPSVSSCNPLPFRLRSALGIYQEANLPQAHTTRIVRSRLFRSSHAASVAVRPFCQVRNRLGAGTEQQRSTAMPIN